MFTPDLQSGPIIDKSCTTLTDADCLRPDPWDGRTRAYCCNIDDEGSLCNEDQGGFGVSPPICGSFLINHHSSVAFCIAVLFFVCRGGRLAMWRANDSRLSPHIPNIPLHRITKIRSQLRTALRVRKHTRCLYLDPVTPLFVLLP